MYVPEENALLEFDVYAKEDFSLRVEIEVSDMNREENYLCEIPVRGGGKWKRIILKSTDFKGEMHGKPLPNFCDGSALSFACADGEIEFSITNILWL